MILGGAHGTVLVLALVLTTTVAQTVCDTITPVSMGSNSYILQPNAFTTFSPCTGSGVGVNNGNVVNDPKVFVFNPPVSGSILG